MKTTANWLQQHLIKQLSIEEITTALNALSIEVDDICKIGGKGFFVVKILHTKPLGDRLKICTIEYTADQHIVTKEVVCGAPNAQIGIYTIMAVEGTKLPNGITLKERYIQGIKSDAMLLSYEEFGLKHMKSDGIIESNKKEFLQYLIEEDYIINISLASNKIDLSSSRGLAQEIADYYDLFIKNNMSNIVETSKAHPIKFVIESDTVLEFSSVAINNIQITDHYDLMLSLLVKITNINSVPMINIGNFVTFDLGIPLHIYNQDQIKELHIKFLKNEEKFITLKEENLLLKPGDIAIKNEKKETVVLAGLIGSDEFKCNEKTTNIFIEAAIFAPESLIITARRLNINNTSSYFFSRGINYHNYLIVFQYLSKFITGDWSKIYIHNHYHQELKEIFISYKDFYQVSKVSVSLDKISELLKKYKYQVKILNKQQDTLNDEMGVLVQPPLWKSYINTPAAVIEDILRIGNFHIPRESLNMENNKLTQNIFYDNKMILKYHCISNGYKEVMTYTFVETGIIEVANPIVQQQKYLRNTLQENMIGHLEKIDIEKLGIEGYSKCFEIDKVFFLDSQNQIQENTNVIFGVCKQQHHYNNMPPELQIKNLLWQIAEAFRFKLELRENINDSNQMKIYINNTEQGYVEFFDKYIICEITNLEKILNKISDIYQYHGEDVKHIENNNILIRDYSFITSMHFDKIEKYFNKIKGISFSLFDVFKDSYGVRVKFYDTSDAKQQEVNAIFKELGLELR